MNSTPPPNGRLPKMARIRHRFPRPALTDIRAGAAQELKRLRLETRLQPGAEVAVTAGSRGIANIAEILRAAVDSLKDAGAKPFIFPAMGSHGGATAQGQIDVLNSYGVSENSMGCPIRSSMDAVEIGVLSNGTPVYCDRHAYNADHIAVINRVKPHTDFNGCVESGLCKMLAIGVGKQLGADYYHKAFLNVDFESTVLGAAQTHIDRGKLLFGLAILENAYDETASVHAIAPEEIIETEQKLLTEARRLMGKLPADPLDCLIIDQIGKNISGTGMDTNIIGRALFPDLYPMPPNAPKALRIAALDLTEKSYGNACGIGLADVTTQRLVDRIDMHATVMNAFTANTPHGVRIPAAFRSDKEAILKALDTIGLTPPECSRTARIKSTLHLSEAMVSEALLPELRDRSEIEIVSEPEEMVFDSNGNLPAFI